MPHTYLSAGPRARADAARATVAAMRAPRAVAALLTSLVACMGAQGGDAITTATSFNVARIAEAERRPAPPVGGEMLAGDPVDIAGRVTVVNFWGSWCGPCREEQPLLEALWKRFGPQGVVFVGINTRRDQRAAALAFLEEFEVTYPSIYDPTSAIAFDYAVRGMPATFVIDRQGLIAARIIGAVRTRAELAEILREELSG